jgi:hypothetical protein
MATVAELDARWEAQYQIVLALRRELTAAQAAVAQSAAYQNGTEAERVALGQVGAVEAARLAFNAENQKLTALKKELDAAVAAEAAEKEATTSPTASAATDVANSAAGATQNPAAAPASTGRLTTTEAATLAQNTETGTNPPVKTLTQTQSVPPANTGNETEGRPGGEPGAGAKGEDGASRANTKQILDTVGNKPFEPKNNVLDQYASYTYNIGWYILTPEQYTKLQTSAKPSISQYNLLMQSGGAPAVQPDLIDASGRRNAASDPRSTTYTGPAAAAGRNPFFGLDYYLDNVELTSTIVGKGAGRANNVGSLKFTVTEPANITLINNLYKAVKQLYPDTNATYSTAYYALVIRFYGYDETGKIVQASNGDNNNAVVEKIIPFLLSNIEFTVSNKLVEYQVTAVGAPYDIGFGSNLGVIKEKIEVSGATVKDLMTKGAGPVEVSPDDGRKTVGELPMKQQAAIAAGTDYNLVNDDGMAFGGGGLTGA